MISADHIRTEVVPDALAGERLDRMVAMVTGVSRAEASALVAAGSVQVDGETRRRGADRLLAGAEMTIALSAPSAALAAERHIVFTVVHADEAVIVVDKPAGLVVHPGAGVEHGTLAQGLLAAYPELAGVGGADRPGIVHRLDKGTSGLMVVARTSRAYDGLVAQLAARQVQREYDALVWGRLEATQGMIDAPIGRSQRTPTRMAVSARGRDARTRYDVERTYADPVEVALLRCRLETGRTHQIRVHLAAIGHPVVGDERYDGVRATLDCPRPFLHAARLAFDHPVTDIRLVFEAALPAELASVLDGLQEAVDS